MPAPQRSRTLKKELFSPTFRPQKPTIFSEALRPSVIAPHIRHLAWAPLGTAIATTSGAHIRIWNPEKPNVKASQELRGHSGAVEKVGWNPIKESELASTGTDGTVRLWDVRIGGGGKSSCVQDIKIGDQGLFMTWSPNGTEIVVGRRDDVIVPVDVRMGVMGNIEAFETREGKKLQTSQTNQMSFSNSGREVFATTGDGTVKILDWPSMSVLHTLNGHTSSAYSVAHSPNGSYVAVGAGDSLISLWDTYDWVCKRTLADNTGAVHALSFTFDGMYICGGCGPDKDAQPGIAVSHVETGETVHTIETTNAINMVAWHPLRYCLAYTGDQGGLRVIGLGSSL